MTGQPVTRPCTDCGTRPRRPGKRNRLCGECLDARYTCSCGNSKAFEAKTCQPCYFSRRGEAHPNWRGGIQKARGYRKIYQPDHPRAHRNYVLEHIVVMEQALGRSLFSHENVHHLNGIRDDNRPENLELWSKSQPAGQRVEEKLQWAKEFISQYIPSPATDPSLGAILRTVAVDFDGTLAHSLWTPNNRTRDIGEPIWENVAKLKELVAAGYSVFIHTSRGYEDGDAIESWLRFHGIPFQFVVYRKPIASAYIDDRAIHESAGSWIPSEG